MTQDTACGYDLLLATFSADPMEAGQMLQLHREKLVFFFDCKGIGITEAERLSDAVLDVALKHLQSGEKIQNIRAFLNQTAHYVWLNYYREVKRTRELFREYEYQVKATPCSSGPDENSALAAGDCYKTCLARLDPATLELLTQYTGGSSETRERLAHELHMNRSSLTVRINRIRTSLRKCHAECIKKKCLD